ncbi:MAG: aminotransferase class V-fold PLP-dependent enzyme [Clostridiaceae bacterium]|nr:aminotransferase class V-fold PLP-dependent enzyme [Clostridiaceae bacterium]MDY5016465.1 aminotransferase class V-fold PLP-dependent enzyme [Eubacteriales bacterium]
MIYLDYAATSYKKPEAVYRAVESVLRRGASVGRGGYPASRFSAERVFACREEVRRLFSAPSEESVVFTCNATMALNMAIKGLLPSGGRAVISGFEHNAVVRPLKALERRGVSFAVAAAPPFDRDAQLEAFRHALSSGAALAVCTQVSNVYGCILPVEEIDALCAEKGVPLVIDASQSAGSVALDLSRLRAARFLCAPGHKGLYGPQGTGVLICRDAEAATLIEGGTGSDSRSYEQPAFLPDRFEAGTLNAAGIAGLGEGVRFINRLGTARILAHERALIGLAARELARIPGVRTFYGGEDAQAGVLSFTVGDVPCETAAERLAAGGIAVRAGLHCAPLAHQTGGTLETGTVRASVSAFSTEADVEALVIAVRALSRG